MGGGRGGGVVTGKEGNGENMKEKGPQTNVIKEIGFKRANKAKRVENKVKKDV